MTASGRTVAAARVAPRRGDALLICALIGTAQMTWGVVVPVLPLFVDALGIPLVVLGMVLAAFAVGRVIANVPAGIAVRRVRPRPFLLTVLVVLAGVTLATGFAPDAAWLIALRFVAGLLAGAAITIGFAVLFAGAPSAARGRVISLATVVQMGAAAVGSVIGGVAVTLGGAPAAFAAAAAPVLLAVGVELVRPARGYWDAFGRIDSEASGADAGVRGHGTLLAVLAFVSFALFFARFGGEQGLLPVLAYESGGLTPLTLGISFAVGTGASAVALVFVGRWVDAGAQRAVLAASVLASVIATAAFGLIEAPVWFGAAIVLYAVGNSMANIVPSVVTAAAFPGRHSGAAVGITRTAGDIGAAAGPLVVFGVGDVVGTWAALGVLIIVPFAATVTLFVQLSRRVAH